MFKFVLLMMLTDKVSEVQTVLLILLLTLDM